MAFRTITPYELEGNTFQMIGKDWALVTAKRGDEVNPMTINWGGLGYLWNRPVATIYVRPQRYTYNFVEKAEGFSISFYDGEYHPQLQYCGTISGRDEDKVAHCGFTTCMEGDVPYFAEAKVVLICKTLYKQDMKEEFALSTAVTKEYPKKDYHRVYIAEVIKVLVQE